MSRVGTATKLNCSLLTINKKTTLSSKNLNCCLFNMKEIHINSSSNKFQTKKFSSIEHSIQNHLNTHVVPLVYATVNLQVIKSIY